MIVKRPEVSYNTIAEQIKRGVNSLTIVEWNFIINSLRVQANVNADQIKYIHSVLFGLEDVSLNSDGVALIPELYDKIYNGVIDRAAADGSGNNIINTYATKTELADLLELIVNETIINRAKHDQHGNVIDETYARVADVEDGTTVAGKALKDGLGNVIKDHYMASVIPTYDDNTNNLYLNPYNGNDSLMPTRVEGVTLPKATTLKDGLMSKEDKVFVNGLPNALLLKENKSEKGVANGYASLDSSAKIPTSQLPDSVLGQLEYKGTFNPNNGYPVSPEKGWFYIAIADALISGVDYQVGDWAVYNGVSWDKIDNTDAVMSVNGKLGNVVLDSTDITYSSGVSVKQKLDDLELLNKINLVDISVAGKYNDLVIGSYINSSGVITGTGDYYRRYVYNEPKFKYIKFGGYGATIVSAIAFYNSTEIAQGNLISSVVYPSGHSDAIYEYFVEIPSNCKCVVFSTRTDKGSYYVYGTILKDITLLKESVSNLNDICYVDNGEEYGINVIGKYIAVNGTDTGTGNYYQETIFNNPKFKYIKVKGCGNVIVSALAFYNSTTISSTNLISSIPYPYGYNFETPYEITAKVPENCACVVFSTRNDRGEGTYYVKPSFEITQDKEESENLQLVVHIEQGGLNTTNLSSSNAIPAGTILKVVVASLAEGTANQDIRMFNSSDSLNSCVVMTDTVGTFYLKANTNINRIYSDQSTRNIEYYVYKVMSPQVAFKNDLIYPVKAHNEKKTLQKGDLIFKNEYWYYDNSAYKGHANHAYLSTQLFLKDAKNLKINFTDNTGKSFQYTIQRFIGGSKIIATGWITNASQTISVDGCESVVIMLRIDGSTFVDLDDLKGIELSVELESFVEDYVSETSMVKHLNEVNRSFKQFPFNFGKQIGHLFINQAFSSNSQTIPCQSIYDVDAQKRMGFKVIHSNCKPTATSGKYVMCHGNGNYLGEQFEGLNGANPATTNVTTSTFDFLRENFVYKSRYVKYKKPITELEEWLKQVKRCNAIPCVQYVDEAQVKIIEKYFPTDYILYGGNRGVTKSWLYLYFSNLTPQNYKVNLSRVISVEGLPLIIAIQHAENFTDEELLDMANFTHENGAYIGIAGCYEQDNQTERCYRAGFDFNISGYEVNQFEDGNLENLTDFEEFGTDGTILSDGTLKLTEGQTIWFNCDKKGFVNKAGVKIIFSGKINVSCGAYNGTNIVNDGKQTSWFSSFIIDDYPAFSITAVEDTIITDIKFVASKC